MREVEMRESDQSTQDGAVAKAASPEDETCREQIQEILKPLEAQLEEFRSKVESAAPLPREEFAPALAEACAAYEKAIADIDLGRIEAELKKLERENSETFREYCIERGLGEYYANASGLLKEQFTGVGPVRAIIFSAFAGQIESDQAFDLEEREFLKAGLGYMVEELRHPAWDKDFDKARRMREERRDNNPKYREFLRLLDEKLGSVNDLEFGFRSGHESDPQYAVVGSAYLEDLKVRVKKFVSDFYLATYTPSLFKESYNNAMEEAGRRRGKKLQMNVFGDVFNIGGQLDTTLLEATRSERLYRIFGRGAGSASESRS